MVGYHWSLAWWFGADDCNFWCFHTNFYNEDTIIGWKLQTISISNSKLWSVIFDTWTLKFTILLPVWSKNSACDTNSPQSWHNPYYSVGGRNQPTRLYELVCPYFSSKSTKHDLKWKLGSLSTKRVIEHIAMMYSFARRGRQSSLVWLWKFASFWYEKFKNMPFFT